ncbi:hypothetical protein [Olsenella sp. HMSC062G07]|uniref:hypothetical protein n=1 Tax=Olsenella sp. HMSC062G07 TaxID=1739330 RepID=UPI0008A15916|nr:hypothetical protein [Olsenella sp. HMSC062G07]OFK24134.1 hypothetical protein HMPREF2826_08395 [Olsenella sp. HMSC062G07]
MGSEYPVEDAKSGVFEHRNYDPAYIFDPDDLTARHHEFDFPDWRANGSPLERDAEPWRRSLETRQDAAHVRMPVVDAEDDVCVAEEALAKAKTRATARRAERELEERRATLRRSLAERERALAGMGAILSVEGYDAEGTLPSILNTISQGVFFIGTAIMGWGFV